MATAQSPMPPPTPVTRLWVRYVVGFSVGVTLGLAPFLGLLEVPLFAPLLRLVPRSMQAQVIPLSAAAMGLLAAIVQWHARDRMAPAVLRRWFYRSIVGAFAGVLLFAILQAVVVTHVVTDGGDSSQSFVVSWARTPACRCDPAEPDSGCIKMVSFDESEIERCWGDRRVRLGKLALTVTYLLATGSFGVTVGVIVLQQTQRSRSSSRRSRTDRRHQ